MKKLSFTFFLAVICSFGFAQDRRIDSLKHALASTKNDTSEVLILVELCDLYHYFNVDSAVIFGNQGLLLSQKINFFRGEVRTLAGLSSSLRQKGEIPESLELLYKALQIAEEKHYIFETALCLENIGDVYWNLKDYPQSIIFCKRGLRLNETIKNDKKYYDLSILINLFIGTSYSKLNKLDSAFIYLKKNYDLTSTDKIMHPVALTYLSEVIFKQGKRQIALNYLHQSIELLKKNNDQNTNSDAYKFMAFFFKEMSQPDSAIYYAKKGLFDAQAIGYKLNILEISKLLSELYYHKDLKLANYYLQLAMSVNDELYGAKKVQELQKTLFNEQHRLRGIETERIKKENQYKLYTLLTGLGMLLLVAFFLLRNNHQKQKANVILQGKNEEIQLTLSKLKSTQTQLIQSEKMASLGELTAGIAHEIQNPLNFVNNFSEVSTELVDELQEEQQKPNRDADFENELLGDLKQNLQKITHHGSRASSIVKGMLEHSRTSTGERQSTDLNALTDEYLRLAYQGFRVKNKELNCELTTDFDPTLGLVEVVPQEIGRVLLNLFNNAFYAVGERVKSQDTQPTYKPFIWVSTKRREQTVEIQVRDNGTGIRDAVKAKIFQPFFTTKPTGEGTGLGLSLSYDIIDKGHGGTLTMESIPGEETAFTIKLPITTE
ncbi:tetratricopeptide repeat-containing sensor histidine kinase [Spirosoma spitsbergense]|uniref:tetratricopeptide repeat-containing sensor histidine kinase n=1 Tax=Spirosoma spitsbergense TaxID=431554 RepID=UPI0003690CA2|nr:ATP-binding protein [Spirosoma spitsbergense]